MLRTYSFRDHLGVTHLLAGSPVIVGIIDSVIAGVLAAIIGQAMGAPIQLQILLGVVAWLSTTATLCVAGYRRVKRVRRDYRVPDVPAHLVSLTLRNPGSLFDERGRSAAAAKPQGPSAAQGSSALESGSPVRPDAFIGRPLGGAQADPASDLSVLVSRARKLIGSDRLIRTDGGYCLRADRVDRDDVVAIVLEASRRLAAGELEAARTRAEAALRLAPGRLPDEPDAPWAVAPRAAMDVQLALARNCRDRGSLSRRPT